MKKEEHDEQVTLIEWFDLEYRYRPYAKRLASTPNGGNRNIITATMLKREGCRKGYPDLNLMVPTLRYHGLFIELKKVGGLKPSAQQQEWIEYLNSQGYLAVVCYGFNEAKKIIEEYLK